MENTTMKRITFLLFFISPFCVSMALAQGEDIALFDETEEVSSDLQLNTPNVGPDARPVTSIRIAPKPFPSIPVSMRSEEPVPTEPFGGQDMAYERRYSDDSASGYAQLATPIDYSKARTVEATKNKIDTVVQRKDTSSTVEKKPSANASSSPVPSKKENISPVQTVPLTQIDTSNFNIADLYLNMTPEDVIETAIDNGFELTNVSYGIPSFMVTNFEKGCRESGLYQLHLIHECVREKAKDEDVYYISQVRLKKGTTNEQIDVLFSSPLTNNEAFKIDYTGFGDNSLGTSYQDLLKKTNRRDVFWQYVNERYGEPTNAELLVWGDVNSVSLRAFLEGNSLNARIILQDVSETGKDYKLAEEWDKEQEVKYPFSF